MSLIPILTLPLRKVATSFFPERYQQKIVDNFCRMVSKGIFGTNLSIRYRGFKVSVSHAELGGQLIYFWALLHGRWRHEQFEQDIIEGLLTQMGPCTVIDIGASYGMYSLLAASLPETQSIIAVEASPMTCAYLKKTIESNGLTTRIRLLNAAASEESGKCFQVVELPNSEWNKVVPSDNSTHENRIPSIAIDDLIFAQPQFAQRPVFIKIDIEGHEPEAFKGMTRLLRDRGNFVIMLEFHVGLLERSPNGARDFGAVLCGLHDTKLFMFDGGNSRMRLLDASSLSELVETAKRARFPGNLFNFLLISDSLTQLLPRQ